MSHTMMKYLFNNENLNSESFAIHKHHFPCGTTFPSHWHDYVEFQIVISGSIQHTLHNTSQLCGPGSAHIISYYDFHGFTVLEDAEIFVIQFVNNFLPTELSQYLSTNSLFYHFSENELSDTKAQVEKIYEKQNSTFHFRDLYIKSVLSELILLILEKVAPKRTIATPLPIQQIIAYIADHYLEKIALEDIAKEFSYYPNYIGKLLKKQTGYNFNEYLNLLRLKHACNLLQNSSLPIKEIAFQSGYHSVEYFSYSFKKFLHTSPKEYKQLYIQSDPF